LVKCTHQSICTWHISLLLPFKRIFVGFILEVTIISILYIFSWIMYYSSFPSSIVFTCQIILWLTLMIPNIQTLILVYSKATVEHITSSLAIETCLSLVRYRVLKANIKHTPVYMHIIYTHFAFSPPPRSGWINTWPICQLLLVHKTALRCKKHFKYTYMWDMRVLLHCLNTCQ